MFQSVQLEILERYDVARRHFESIYDSRVPVLAATSRGMCFVQIYAAWEYAVKASVRAALSVVCTHEIPLWNVRLELTSLLLLPELMSVTDSAKENLWQRTCQLFRQIGSRQFLDSPPDAFPSDGSQFRLSQVYVIWEIFGITAPVVPDPRLTNLIGEVVNHRNEIAHGRKTPNEVGRRYSKEDVERKIDGMQDISIHLASSLEIHCGAIANLARR